MFGGMGWSQKLSPLKTNLLNHWTNSILEIYRELWFIISHNMWYDKIDLLVNIFCAVEFINFFFFACTVTSMFILFSIVLPLLYYKGHGHVLVVFFFKCMFQYLCIFYNASCDDKLLDCGQSRKRGFDLPTNHYSLTSLN